MYGDVSINGLIINNNDKSPSWRAFVIDPDIVIREREGASGAKGKTGTRAFMAGHYWAFLHDAGPHALRALYTLHGLHACIYKP